MIKFDGEILLTTDEFSEKLGVSIKTARQAMNERDGHFIVNIGKKRYICWERYQDYILNQLKEEKNYDTI